MLLIITYINNKIYLHLYIPENESKTHENHHLGASVKSPISTVEVSVGIVGLSVVSILSTL